MKAGRACHRLYFSLVFLVLVRLLRCVFPLFFSYGVFGGPTMTGSVDLAPMEKVVLKSLPLLFRQQRSTSPPLR